MSIKNIRMKNETKLKKLMKFLEENGIEFIIPIKHGRRWHSDLVLPKYKVCIKIQGEYDEVFFQKHKAGKYPVFIRDADTPKFVIEKVQNTIIKSMKDSQSCILKRRMMAEGKTRKQGKS